MTVQMETINAEAVTVIPPCIIMTTEGHPLTVRNIVFLLSQCGENAPQPTIIGGFRQWRTQGRTVRKGEKALKIFAPSTRKTQNAKGEKDTSIYFRMVSVFDITQTVELESETEV